MSCLCVVGINDYEYDFLTLDCEQKGQREIHLM